MPSELNFRANIFGFKLLGVERDPLGERRRQAAARTTSRSTSCFPTSSSTAPAAASARSSATASSPTSASRTRSAGRCRRIAAEAPRGVGATRPPRRHLRLHGRAAVLDAGRVEPVPVVGRGRHRHDQSAGGQARARSRDLLRDDGARDRLRLLAPGSRRGDGGDDHRQPDAERRRPRSRSSPTRSTRAARRACRCASALATAIITRPDASQPTQADLAPIIGKYLK